MNTVLPERESPVTARLTVEPCAMSARLAASASHPDALARYGAYQGAVVMVRWSSGTVSQGPDAAILGRAGEMEVRFQFIRLKSCNLCRICVVPGKNLA